MSGLEQRLGIAAALATAAVTYVHEIAGRRNARPEGDGPIRYGNGSGRSFISEGLTIISEPENETPKA